MARWPAPWQRSRCGASSTCTGAPASVSRSRAAKRPSPLLAPSAAGTRSPSASAAARPPRTTTSTPASMS
eukprot:5940128-Lingulodinium_polyedra.AAC.1